MLKVTILFFIVLHSCLGYYEREFRGALPTGKTLTDDSEATISIIQPSRFNSPLPESFRVTYRDLANKVVSREFQLDDGLANKPSTDVYTIGSSNNLNKIDGTDVHVRTYKSTTDNFQATVYDNTWVLNNQGASSANKFSVIINSLDDKDNTITILPVLKEYVATAKNGGKSIVKQLGHKVKIGKQDDLPNFFNDYAKAEDEPMENNHEQRKYEESRRVKRGAGGPVTAYVEVVMMVDYSLYQRYLINANTTDQKMCFLFIKIYYSHFMTIINRRYYNTFVNDPDLMVQVRLTNFVIHTSEADAPWADSSIVGVPGNATATYNGRQIIVATTGLAALRNYMNNRTWPFTYDHAFGVTDKDLWSSDTAASAGSRSAVAGYAYVTAICGGNRYSINEDRGFYSILILAHELGHSLGAPHDGDTGNPIASLCNATENYIMVPGVGSNTIFTNYYRFSNCSMISMKNTLLDSATGQLKSSMSCLANATQNDDVITSFYNSSLGGQLFNADDQCKLLYGPASNANTCAWALKNICQTILCKDNGNCWGLGGVGAIDGTPCNASHICLNGFCVSNTITTVTNFPANACSPNPCKNNAACVPLARFYLCNCASGFYGQNCESGSATGHGITNNPSVVFIIFSVFILLTRDQF